MPGNPPKSMTMKFFQDSQTRNISMKICKASLLVSMLSFFWVEGRESGILLRTTHVRRDNLHQSCWTGKMTKGFNKSETFSRGSRWTSQGRTNQLSRHTSTDTSASIGRFWEVSGMLFEVTGCFFLVCLDLGDEQRDMWEWVGGFQAT